MIAILLFVCVSAPSISQEYWLAPQRYYYSIREMAYIQLKGADKKEPANSIEDFLHYRPNGTIVSIGNLLSRDSIALPLQETGTHMIALQRSQELERRVFDSFYTDPKREDHPGTEKPNQKTTGKRQDENIMVQQSLKTLVQVGGTLSDACIRPTGLLLDIIPEENPYSVPQPGRKERPVTVRFRVLFQGIQLPNARVIITYQLPGKGWKNEYLVTNKRGWVLAERHTGAYRVSCIYQKPSENDPSNRMEYYFGSLSFDYSQYFR